MATFRQLVASSSPLLLIDAASSLVQVGASTAHGAMSWQTGTDEAGVAIFQAIERLGFDPQSANAFVFCEGPGSVLGIRTAAMAIRTWCVLKPRPVFAYSSLALVAHALARPEVTVIADARRDSWHAYQIGRGLRRAQPADLSGELAMPEHFRHWSPLPANVSPTPYSLPALLTAAGDADLFHAADAPDAFLHEEPSYVTWTPAIHRAPTQ